MSNSRSDIINKALFYFFKNELKLVLSRKKDLFDESEKEDIPIYSTYAMVLILEMIENILNIQNVETSRTLNMTRALEKFNFGNYSNEQLYTNPISNTELEDEARKFYEKLSFANERREYEFGGLLRPLKGLKFARRAHRRRFFKRKRLRTLWKKGRQFLMGPKKKKDSTEKSLVELLKATAKIDNTQLPEKSNEEPSKQKQEISQKKSSSDNSKLQQSEVQEKLRTKRSLNSKHSVSIEEKWDKFFPARNFKNRKNELKNRESRSKPSQDKPQVMIDPTSICPLSFEEKLKQLYLLLNQNLLHQDSTLANSREVDITSFEEIIKTFEESDLNKPKHKRNFINLQRQSPPKCSRTLEKLTQICPDLNTSVDLSILSLKTGDNKKPSNRSSIYKFLDDTNNINRMIPSRDFKSVNFKKAVDKIISNLNSNTVSSSKDLNKSTSCTDEKLLNLTNNTDSSLSEKHHFVYAFFYVYCKSCIDKINRMFVEEKKELARMTNGPILKHKKEIARIKKRTFNRLKFCTTYHLKEFAARVVNCSNSLEVKPFSYDEKASSYDEKAYEIITNFVKTRLAQKLRVDLDKHKVKFDYNYYKDFINTAFYLVEKSKKLYDETPPLIRNMATMNRHQILYHLQNFDYTPRKHCKTSTFDKTIRIPNTDYSHSLVNIKDQNKSSSFNSFHVNRSVDEYQNFDEMITELVNNKKKIRQLYNRDSEYDDGKSGESAKPITIPAVNVNKDTVDSNKFFDNKIRQLDNRDSEYDDGKSGESAKPITIPAVNVNKDTVDSNKLVDKDDKIPPLYDKILQLYDEILLLYYRIPLLDDKVPPVDDEIFSLSNKIFGEDKRTYLSPTELSKIQKLCSEKTKLHPFLVRENSKIEPSKKNKKELEKKKNISSRRSSDLRDTLISVLKLKGFNDNVLGKLLVLPISEMEELARILSKITPEEEALVHAILESGGHTKVAEWVAFIVEADPLDTKEWRIITNRTRRFLKKSCGELFLKVKLADLKKPSKPLKLDEDEIWYLVVRAFHLKNQLRGWRNRHNPRYRRRRRMRARRKPRHHRRRKTIKLHTIRHLRRRIHSRGVWFLFGRRHKSFTIPNIKKYPKLPITYKKLLIRKILLWKFLEIIIPIMRGIYYFARIGQILTNIKVMIKLFPDNVLRNFWVVRILLELSDPFEGFLLCLAPLGIENGSYFDCRRYLVPRGYKVLGELSNAFMCRAISIHEKTAPVIECWENKNYKISNIKVRDPKTDEIQTITYSPRSKRSRPNLTGKKIIYNGIHVKNHDKTLGYLDRIRKARRDIPNRNPNYRRVLREVIGYLIKLLNDEIRDLFFQLLTKSAVRREIIGIKIVSLWQKRKNLLKWISEDLTEF